MTREELWNNLIKRNPPFVSNPHFTSDGFRKLFVTVWDHGFSQGIDEYRPSKPPLSNETYGIFDGIFGKQK